LKTPEQGRDLKSIPIFKELKLTFSIIVLPVPLMIIQTGQFGQWQHWRGQGSGGTYGTRLLDCGAATTTCKRMRVAADILQNIDVILYVARCCPFFLKRLLI
jgi:hypothetical protein